MIFQDADLEYMPPKELCDIITPFLNRVSNAVMGSHFLHKHPRLLRKTKVTPFSESFQFGDPADSMGSPMPCLENPFSDYEGCYKAFFRSTLLDTPVRAKGFEFDNELICKLMRKGVRIEEVPIRYIPRTYGQGKKITWRHGITILWTIIKWRFLPIHDSHQVTSSKMAA